jgi:shikimate kinase
MNIILFGFKKCGKVYFGMKMARELDREFIESDHLLQELYSEEYHDSLSYREIEKKHGFPFFCKYEEKVVSRLVQKKNCIISLGGGVVLNEKNVKRLKQAGTLIYLKGSKETLKKRILSGDIPHYLDSKHPGDSFEDFYAKRMPIYEKVDAIQIDIENKTEEMITSEIYTLTHTKNEPHP